MVEKQYVRAEALRVWGPLRYEGNGLLLYEYVRGSHAYGLATAESDQDRGGVFLASNDVFLGMTSRNGMYDYTDQEHSASNDEVWYEFSRFAELVCECNPNIIESLFVDDAFVLYEHPIITELKKHRDEFITKECFSKFGGYAKSQIEKARGLKKKIVCPVNEKKSPLDFCYTFNSQGSVKITSWLEQRNLKQEFCGLVAIPNMHNTYGVYYDWAAHVVSVPGLRDILIRQYNYCVSNGPYIFTQEERDALREFEEQCWEYATGETFDKRALTELVKGRLAGYRGIVVDDSQDLRLSSVPEKGIKPICHLVYNKEGYSRHAKDYTEYKKWEKERNPVRYSLDVGMNYDRKNMMHSFRLLLMNTEIARGEGVKVYRDIDRSFLLGIRNTKYTFEELMKQLTKLDEDRVEAQKNSVIPDKIDKRQFNRWVIEQRKKYGNYQQA